ncbi:MAG TPA: phenylalanine--tRNA ligase subunit beta, partial [Chloroflexota bacterium]
MRVPLQWLADFVDLEIDVDELAHRLTMAGLKVEAIERIGADWQDVVVGQVVELEPHPRSTKPLHVTRVSLSSDHQVTIVTGAQNVKLHAKVAVVPVGGLLPHGPDGRPIVIESRPMVGITSHGMLASEYELGISDEHSGIMILPDHAEVGTPLRSLLGDDVLDIETNPNRPDTLSIIGIAREVAAVTEQQVRLPDPTVMGANVERVNRESVPVEIDAPDLCPRYSALRIEGLSVSASPDWIVRRLELCKVRSINLPVDLTNYVMLEWGQPMHAFDGDQLHGGKIVVRRAEPGEHLTTLDGVTRSLTPDNLVIADGRRAVGLAGVMGGENSEILDDTRTLVLESANFAPVNVRRTAQSLGLRTESSTRFEKGLPPEQTVPALHRYFQLLAQASGAPLRAYEISDVWPEQPGAHRVTMPLRDLDRLLGIHIEEDVAAEKLSLLGFGVEIDGQNLTADVPYWRRADVERSADLVEEVARLVGFDRVPSTLFRRTMEIEPESAERQWESRIRNLLLGAGVNEITTHSLTSPSAMARLAGIDSRDSVIDPDVWQQLVVNPAGVFAHDALTLPVELLNPATVDRQVLRITLLPGVLGAVAH